jgi:hypothetical protein
MLGLILILLAAYVVMAIIGLVIHGLIWLFWIAVILFVITSIAKLFQSDSKSGGRSKASSGDNEKEE